MAFSGEVIAWDTETELIRPGLLAPPLVCVTWQSPGHEAAIVHHADAEPILRGWLESGARLVGHNVAYDLAVVCERFPALRKLVFKAYRENRVTDTQIRQWLLDNAAGMFRGRIGSGGKWITHEYTLEALAKRAAGMRLQKDGWRLSYGKFKDVPLKDWSTHARNVQAEARITLAEREAVLATHLAIPKSKRDDAAVKALEKELEGLREMIASEPEQCLKYPLDDARATLAVYLAQEKHAHYLADQFRQSRAYFALHLESAWGLRTDAHGVEVLRREIQSELDEIEDDLKAIGLVRADGSRDTKAAKARMIEACERGHMPIIRTAAHENCADGDACKEHICLDADACEASEDDVLIDYSKLTTLKKVLSNDLVALAGGILYPVHTRYGFAATGRSTSSKPNIQNQSNREGIREAFIPREGHYFAQCDYPQLELWTLAQCCVSWFGKSKLAEALLAGRDPHLEVAAVILKWSYADTAAAFENEAHPQHKLVKKVRKLAKPANFGFPGGMGAPKLVLSTRKQMGRVEFAKLELDEARARVLRDQYFEAWPEMEQYFARVNQLVAANENGRATVETLFTRRVRGNATYCATANNGFQALGADCAKNAAWLIAEACYANEESPLFNSRAVGFIHDEFIAEVPADERAHDAANALADCMIAGANEFLPDVPIPRAKMKPALMKRWYKAAEPRFDARGRLVPWESAAPALVQVAA